MLGLDGDLDPLIRPSDLPGAASEPAAEPVAAEPVAAVSAEQFLAGAPEGRFPDLDAARRQQRSARETLSILREAAERARRDHADAAAALRRARLAVDEANGRAAGNDEAARLLDDVLFDPPDAPSSSAPPASRGRSGRATRRPGHAARARRAGTGRAVGPRHAPHRGAGRRHPQPGSVRDGAVRAGQPVGRRVRRAPAAGRRVRGRARGPGPRHRVRARMPSKRPAPSWPRPSAPCRSRTCRPTT